MKLNEILSNLSTIFIILSIIGGIIVIYYLAYLIKTIIDLLKVIKLRANELKKTIQYANQITENTKQISNSAKNISNTMESLFTNLIRFVSKSTVDTTAFLFKIIKERDLLKKVRGEK